jgi:surface polysaccharide O-acyltransferase-like enzyme
MIPVLHILGKGGILASTEDTYLNNIVSWLLEISAYCAVNIYALISGFVNQGKEIKYSNIIYLYFQVLFYTLTVTLFFMIYEPEQIGIMTIVKAIFPFAYGTYWYFTAYFCLFFIIPFLNFLVDKFNKKELRRLILTLIVIFSILPTFFYYDMGYTKEGYSFLWLAILYLLGAYIKKYNISLNYKNIYNLYGYLLCVIITWISRLIIETLTKRIFNVSIGENYLIKYTSPTILLCAVFLLLFFKDIKYNKLAIRFIRFFAPLSFGVYLLHEEHLIRDNFIREKFYWYAEFNPIVLIIAVVLTAIAVWLIGSFADRIRLLIFDILKIRKICIWIEVKIRSVILFFDKCLHKLLS